MDENLVIVRSEEKAAVRNTEFSEHDFEQNTCECQLVTSEADLLELENGVDEVNVIVQISVELRVAVFVCRE